MAYYTGFVFIKENNSVEPLILKPIKGAEGKIQIEEAYESQVDMRLVLKILSRIKVWLEERGTIRIDINKEGALVLDHGGWDSSIDMDMDGDALKKLEVILKWNKNLSVKNDE